MNCSCYEKAFAPVIKLLEEADGLMYFRTPEYDLNRQRIHDIILSMNLNFRCINDCYKQVKIC